MAAVVERWNGFVTRPDGGKGVRMDLFGFIDVLAVDELAHSGVLAVQVARTGDAARRLEKIKSARVWPKVARWLQAGNRMELWDYSLRVADNGRKKYTLRVTPVTLLDEDDACGRSHD
jgi:hypothetical protein